MKQFPIRVSKDSGHHFVIKSCVFRVHAKGVVLSGKGVFLPSMRLLDRPFLEPLLRTLLRTLSPL